MTGKFVPKHRAGGVPAHQRAMLRAAPLANKVGEALAPPVVQSPKVLQGTTAAKIAGGTAKAAGMYLLSKSAHEVFLSKSYLGGNVFKPISEMSHLERAAHRAKMDGHLAPGVGYALENGAPRTLFHGTNEASAKTAARTGWKNPADLPHSMRAVKAGHDQGVWGATTPEHAGRYAHQAFFRGPNGTTKAAPAVTRYQTTGRPKAAGHGGRTLEFDAAQTSKPKIMRRSSRSLSVLSERTAPAPDSVFGRHVKAGGPSNSGSGKGTHKGTYRGE